MIKIKQTETFRKWRKKLKDDHVRALIASRLDRLSYGHFGDSKSIDQGIYELRIHYGPGYRIYFKKQNKIMIILLCAGDKASQEKDIKIAKRIFNEWRKENG